MHPRAATAVPLLTVAVLTLAGCGSGGPARDASGPSSGPMSGPTLRLASTDVGRVLVDAAGRTVYVYDKDRPGESVSACTGPCVGLWPAVAAGDHPTLGAGVHGELGTVTGPSGAAQLTLDGHPLYTYASDQEAGDAYGQGYDGIWWVVGADGAKSTTPASSSDAPSEMPSSSSGGGGGYGGGY